MVIKEITSSQNDLIKEILVLQEKSKARKKSGLFIIEGRREITLALKGNYELIKILFCEEIINEDKVSNLNKGSSQLIKISAEVYQKIAHRGSTEGILAIAKAKNLDLKSLVIANATPLILVAEAPEKPGNIGALLRTADAANLDAVLIANPKTDLYNPNIIRASIGCVFTNNIAMGSNEEILELLQSKNIKIFAAALGTSKPYDQVDYTSGTAIVVGTEATGLSDSWLNAALERVMIPMQGQIDSLNVSVSAAVIIFEAKRQRNNE